jgi:hypothetical protein
MKKLFQKSKQAGLGGEGFQHVSQNDGNIILAALVIAELN